MALKVLLLCKQLENKRKALDELCGKDEDFAKREAEMEAAIAEITNDDEVGQVQEAIDGFRAERDAHEAAKSELERTVTELEGEIAQEEAAQETEQPKNEKSHGKEADNMSEDLKTRAGLGAIVTRDDVKAYLGEVRTAIKEKRALTNVGLTIPEVLLGLLRENVERYSKLYRHVTVRRVGGTARQLIMGTVPEAVWTDCCANLNELSLVFNDLEMDCYKVGGFFAVCNANLEDSDIDLAAELMTTLGQAIGKALDKAILYGRNATTTQKMPQGIVSRLVQTEAPSGYPATARPWADLHTTNVLSIASGTTGAALFAAIATAFAPAKGSYSRGEKVFAMNEATYSKIVAAAAEVDASGAIVSGVNGTMPIVGGTIEVLSFLPDNVIVAGYFDLYTLAERAGEAFASSEHVRFLQDQTVFKGTARYDGAPAIAEAFVAIGLEGTTPTATMTFASDTANA